MKKWLDEGVWVIVRRQDGGKIGELGSAWTCPPQLYVKMLKCFSCQWWEATEWANQLARTILLAKVWRWPRGVRLEQGHYQPCVVTLLWAGSWVSGTGQGWRRFWLLKVEEGRARCAAELPVQQEEVQEVEAPLGAPQAWPSWGRGSFSTSTSILPEPAGQSEAARGVSLRTDTRQSPSQFQSLESSDCLSCQASSSGPSGTSSGKATSWCWIPWTRSWRWY